MGGSIFSHFIGRKSIFLRGRENALVRGNTEYSLVSWEDFQFRTSVTFWYCTESNFEIWLSHISCECVFWCFLGKKAFLGRR